MVDSWNPAVLNDGLRSGAAGGGGGTTVEANPEGEATATLSKLGVDDTIYGIPAPTTVVANPEGEATSDLTKLQVGSSVYGIPAPTTVEANPAGSATVDLEKLQVGSTIYGMPAPSVEYSTTEKAIGKWTDGSTLYQRSFYTESISTDWNVINDATLNVLGYVNEVSFFDGTSSLGYHRFALDSAYGGTTVSFIVNDTVHNGTTHGNVHIVVSGSNMSYRAAVTLIYTKA